MNAFADTPSTTKPAWHDGFMALLPAIHDQVRYAFRSLPPEARQEAIQEALASAAVAFARLHAQGRAELAYSSPLARYAIRHFRAGRQVGGRLNVNDVLSPYAQKHHGIVVERLDRRDPSGQWKEILVEDRGFSPAETAAVRLDFADWLGRLRRRDRDVVTTLAAGENGNGVAQIFDLTKGRVSQLRSELRRNWHAFQGEPVEEAGELAMAGC